MRATDDLPDGYVVDYAYGANNSQIALVPEPSTLVLLALAGLTLAAWNRR